jgi:hypothetical protein
MKKPVYWMFAIMTQAWDTLAMKCVSVAKALAVRLEFTLPEEGKYNLQLWVDCDSYMGLSRWIYLDHIVVRS